MELMQDTPNPSDDQPLVPLHSTAWELDRVEGDYVNGLKATRTEPMAEPLLEVPGDL